MIISISILNSTPVRITHIATWAYAYDICQHILSFVTLVNYNGSIKSFIEVHCEIVKSFK